MGKTTVTGTHHTTQTLTGFNNVIQVNSGARIEVETPTTSYGIWEQADGSRNTAIVNGTVWGLNASSAHGLVKGDYAIAAEGANLTVVSPGAGIQADIRSTPRISCSIIEARRYVAPAPAVAETIVGWPPCLFRQNLYS